MGYLSSEKKDELIKEIRKCQGNLEKISLLSSNPGIAFWTQTVKRELEKILEEIKVI